MVPENRPGVVKMFKQIHQDVEKKSKEFYDVFRRYNYVTPTSYLELLSSFDTLLQYKRGEVKTKKNRLKIGLDKIISTGELVEGMQKVRDAALKLKLNLSRDVAIVIVRIHAGARDPRAAARRQGEKKSTR